MEFFVVMLNAAKHLHCLFNGGFVDGNRLEATLKRGILLDIFAVFIQCSRTDDLYLTARKSGFEDISSVHASLGVSCTNDVVNFINDKNCIANRSDLSQQTEDTRLELSAELRTCNKRSHIQKINLFSL